MLERAPTCLETGGRQLLRRPTPCLRTRRMLHSTFWHHGATDLSLPAWWAAPSAPDRNAGNNNGGNESVQESKGYDGLLLDFLYPKETLSLIRRISTTGSEMMDGQQRYRSGTGGIRHFSTTTWMPMRVSTEIIEPLELQAQKEFEEETRSSSAYDALERLLSSSPQEKQALAWRLFVAIPDGECTPETKCQLLQYLATPTTRSSPNQLLRLFDGLPRENRLSHSYEAAISAYLMLEMVGPAVQLQEEAVGRGLKVHKATGSLLGRTTRDNQWELALRVMTRFIASIERSHEDSPYPDYYERNWYQRPSRYRSNGALNHELLWNDVNKLPYLRGHLESFLIHIEQFKHETMSTPESELALKHLLYGLAVETLEQVMAERDISNEMIRTFVVGLFQDLRRLALPRFDLFEYAIIRMPTMERFQEYSSMLPIFLELYQQYREEVVQDSTSSRRPSRRLLITLIEQFGRHRSTRAIENFLEDFHKFHSEHELLPTHLLRYLMQYYAESGQVDKVHHYFGELLRKPDLKLDIFTINRLHYAYARRADVPGTEQQFKRIFEEFGLEPNITSWNMLLLAYVRADDLDGALSCFNRILDSELFPDIYTIGPLLDMCAARGDIEAFEILYSKAEQLNIPIKKDIRARAGYVETCLNMDDPEGAEATAQAMLKAQRVGKLHGNLTQTWNMLIQYYALRGDVGTSRRLYREMVENNIPLDSWTYASLMRALIEVKQTNAAYKILRVTMRKNNVRIHAFHYALVITGFLRERQYGQAKRASREMKILRVPQTTDSRMASLEVTGIAELDKLRREKNDDPHVRLKGVEESLREILLADYKSEVAHRQPRVRKMIDYRQGVPEGYFGLLILLYGKRGAFDVCKQLFETVAASEAKFKDWEAPVNLLTAIMESHYRAGEHEEVARCWKLVLSQAQGLIKTLQTIMDPPQPKVEFSSLLDPSIKESFDSAKIATNRRQVITRAARIYIRSLISQQHGLQEAQRTIRSLLTSGFIVDNLTWNEFIQMLARRGRILDSFSACEAYLMPAFPGWRALSPYYHRKNLPGLIWMDLRHDEVSHKTLMPRYKTLVILAAAYAQVRRDEVNGVGYSPEMGGWTREILEKLSPLTVRAIETMPRTGDRLQATFLSDMM